MSTTYGLHSRFSIVDSVWDQDNHIKRLVLSPSPYGIDFRWRLWSPKDEAWVDSPTWGNSKDTAAAKSCIEELRTKSTPFLLEPESEALLRE